MPLLGLSRSVAVGSSIEVPASEDSEMLKAKKDEGKEGV